MDRDLSVIYYTANKEEPAFEARIRQKLLETIGDLPLISVSQEPIAFGKNICVGKVGVSGQNAIRQFQIGAQEAKTRYVCSAEADFLYPAERFQFVPESENVFYGVTNWYVVWMLSRHARCASKKFTSPFGPLTVGRELMIRAVEQHLAPQESLWSHPTATGPPLPNFYDPAPLQPLHTEAPLVTFKTEANMHRKTARISRRAFDTIPFWGNVRDLIAQYCGNGHGD